MIGLTCLKNPKNVLQMKDVVLRGIVEDFRCTAGSGDRNETVLHLSGGGKTDDVDQIVLAAFLFKPFHFLLIDAAQALQIGTVPLLDTVVKQSGGSGLRRQGKQNARAAARFPSLP